MQSQGSVERADWPMCRPRVVSGGNLSVLFLQCWPSAEAKCGGVFGHATLHTSQLANIYCNLLTLFTVEGVRSDGGWR